MSVLRPRSFLAPLAVLVLAAALALPAALAPASTGGRSDLRLQAPKPITDAVGPGGTRSLTWVIFAVGTGPSPGSSLALTFPADTLVRSLSAPGGNCVLAPGKATCPLGDLQVGARVAVTGNFVSRSNGTHTIGATAASVEEDLTPANNSGTTAFFVDALKPNLTTVAFSQNNFLFVISERGTVTMTFDAGPRLGKRVGAKCVPGKAAKGKSCNYVIRQPGEVVIRAKKGENKFKFNGKVAGKTLKPGHYVVRLSPKDMNNNFGVQRKKGITLFKKK